MNHNEVKVYPLYLDSALKRAEGRKITKEEGIENPNINAMFRAVKTLGFEAKLEQERRHPKDFWRFGRLSVVFFKEENGKKVPINPTLNTRIKLFKAIANDLKVNGNSSQSAHNVGGKKDSAERARLKREAKKARK